MNISVCAVHTGLPIARIAAFMAWRGMVLFKGRSPVRDKSSDEARIAALVRQIDDVRTGVMKERRGLERRYSDVVGEASHMVDTDYSGERDDALESRLSSVENDALYARKRMAELDRHLESLSALTERVKVMFDPVDEIARLRKQRRRSDDVPQE